MSGQKSRSAFLLFTRLRVTIFVVIEGRGGASVNQASKACSRSLVGELDDDLRKVKQFCCGRILVRD